MMELREVVTSRVRLLVAALAACAVLIPVPAARADHRVPFDGTTHAYGEMVDYPLVFPVVGPHTLRDTFHASRAGGEHHAQDIMADKMTPVVAAASGTVERVNWSRSPSDLNPDRCCTIVITHDDGWETWYIHLNNDTPGTDDGAGWGIAGGIVPGARVEAGDLIGWVGDSGNAESTPPHLHFELYDPEGVLVNPYDSLLAATRIDCGSACLSFLPLELGDEGVAVFDVQMMLGALGYDPGPADGMFGPLTRTAVRDFQSSASLAVTGVVDQLTWTVLVASSEGAADAVAADVLDAGFESGSVAGSAHRFLGRGGSWDVAGSAVRSGAWAAEYSAAGQSKTAVLVVNGAVGDGSGVPVEPGDLVRFSAWVAGSGGAGNRVQPRVVFFDGDGNRLRKVTQRALVPTGSWQQVSVGGVAPQGAAYAVFQVRIRADGTGGRYHFDDLEPAADGWEPFAGGAPEISYDPARGAEQWRPLVEYVFALWGLDAVKCGTGTRSSDCIGSQVDNAIVIMQCESSGDPTVVNPSSGTTGLFQHRPVFWTERTGRVRVLFPGFSDEPSLTDPYDNVMVAALLVHESRDALIGENSLTGPWDDGPAPWGHWDSSSRYCASPPLVSP